ncbi:PTS lactose/cellobiose transporter subunit IIA [Metabacillus arenae]|uniref:PTS lactose/cellobiose transporter subunit IIA n=1 Tax=Metabacillus arenae TaxID=2771434 RepID=A0A926RXW1_9BACI|nr:PTS lactose/cellobiose transporter subunit IIA [Metabacillus arenae]MBD1380567.1 PTS lactose/cellobiose transporter subunit IIA [Metabacillus arenae]
MTEKMELICFQIISQAGAARSSFMEALKLGRESKFEEAGLKVKEAALLLSEGHKVHSQLIQKEAAGEKVPVSLLTLHAEDLMMTTETMGELVKEMVFMYEEFRK